MRLIDADVFKENMDYICDAGGWLEPVTKAVREFVKRHIDAQTTVKPEQQWIPCSERLPKEKDAGILKKFGTEKLSGYVLATVEVKGERMTVTACTYDGKWDLNMKYAFPDFKVVAWQPLPEPYQEEGEQE